MLEQQPMMANIISSPRLNLKITPICCRRVK